MQVAGQSQFDTLVHFFPFKEREGFFEATTPQHSGCFRVAILEGNISLARLLATGLSADALRIAVFPDAQMALRRLEAEAPDLLLLDLDLPADREGVDGWALLRKARLLQPEMRLLALSGRAAVKAAVEALEQGADDYLAKPVSLLEVRARVHALRRRSSEAAPGPPGQLTGELVLERHQGRVVCDGQWVDLTPRECALLEFLMAHPGTTLSRATLSQKVWNMPVEANTNIVDVYVKYLRDKLERSYGRKLIHTVRGVGYVFQVAATESASCAA